MLMLTPSTMPFSFRTFTSLATPLSSRILGSSNVLFCRPFASLAKRKDPDRPARPLTPYLRFTESYRKEKGLKGGKDTMKELGAAWKTLPEQRRQPFIQAYEMDRSKYVAAFQAYKDSGKLDAWKRDPNKPKAPPTPYIRYLNEFRKSDQAKNLKATEVVREGGKQWKVVPPEKKKTLEAAYQNDKAKHTVIIQQYKASGKEVEWKKKVGIWDEEQKVLLKKQEEKEKKRKLADKQRLAKEKLKEKKKEMMVKMREKRKVQTEKKKEVQAKMREKKNAKRQALRERTRERRKVQAEKQKEMQAKLREKEKNKQLKMRERKKEREVKEKKRESEQVVKLKEKKVKERERTEKEKTRLKQRLLKERERAKKLGKAVPSKAKMAKAALSKAALAKATPRGKLTATDKERARLLKDIERERKALETLKLKLEQQTPSKVETKKVTASRSTLPPPPPPRKR